jgi:twitching motility protein PilT
MDITKLLIAVLNNKGSDLHLSSGLSPMIRIHGDIVPIEIPALENEAVKQLIYSIMSDNQKKTFESNLELDFSFEIPNVSRFRANVFYQQRGMAAVFRTIPSKILTLEQLNCPPIFKQLAEKPRGLVLVTGPTGSGKSTTLAAMVNYINATYASHILTIEDPIEFVHTPQKCVVNQRELGPHTKSFAAALKSALREDPDVILVGEMRDIETISLAMTAAETGHLVFGTLHTSSAPKTIDRIVDVFPGEEKEMARAMLSESLQAVITQCLVKKKDGSGRLAVHEILVGTPAIRNLIRENKIAQMSSAMQTGAKDGMRTLDATLEDLVRNAVISKEDARAHANDKSKFI